MNRTMTTLVALGVGAYAYKMARGNNLMSNRTMKQLRKRVTKMM
ncbi:YrzQ family protein [Bacillus suaedaesalsae]|uniref:YrzQ family protein n=1 Tax=Bacillus suaedaesalsae TaxID=2810349 RepID=A0ABS2DMG1_9BACI|nr:YrzQ family protein [Bacillus suaedaesalsae]MBM6619690.1 YrzQ family protein [Bacillus suaedaesalsae]